MSKIITVWGNPGSGKSVFCAVLAKALSEEKEKVILTLKHTLLPVLEKFSDVRVVQSRLETLLSQPRREAVTMMLLVAANIPLLYVLNRSWFNTLLYTTPGQIALAVCAGIVLFAAVRVLKLSKPIEYSR